MNMADKRKAIAIAKDVRENFTTEEGPYWAFAEFGAPNLGLEGGEDFGDMPSVFRDEGSRGCANYGEMESDEEILEWIEKARSW